LRLVAKGERDATGIFDNMDKLRADIATPLPQRTRSEGLLRSRRKHEAETFARIPHDRALELFRRRIGEAAWIVLIELDRVVLAQRGKNPVLFWSPRLRAAGLVSRARIRALRRLEAAGVVEIEYRGSGLSPWVTHLWYPQRE
jgi:hypothetical protein